MIRILIHYILFIQPEARQDAIDALVNDALNRPMKLNVEYKANGMDYVTLLDDDENAGKKISIDCLKIRIRIIVAKDLLMIDRWGRKTARRKKNDPAK